MGPQLMRFEGGPLNHLKSMDVSFFQGGVMMRMPWFMKLIECKCNHSFYVHIDSKHKECPCCHSAVEAEASILRIAA